MHRDHLHLCLYRPSGARCEIRFENGDITAPGEMADLLIISAFSQDYTETRSSVIGALARKGVHVRTDVWPDRETLGSEDCWISRELEREVAAAIGARRILCYEGDPTEPGALGALGGLRSLLAAVMGRAPHPENPPWSIHMPLIGAGNQGGDPVVILRLLAEAVQESFATGLNVRSVRIFEHRDARFKPLRGTFQDVCDRYNPFTAEWDPQVIHRLFVSYSHEVKAAADPLHQEITARLGPQVFFDTGGSVNQGMVLSRDLALAVRQSRAMIAIISPAYVASPACRVEFMTAYSRHYLRKQDFVLGAFFFGVRPERLPFEFRDVIGEICGTPEDLTTRVLAFVERLPDL
jgi:hypothetical protein